MDGFFKKGRMVFMSFKQMEARVNFIKINSIDMGSSDDVVLLAIILDWLAGRGGQLRVA